MLTVPDPGGLPPSGKKEPDAGKRMRRLAMGIAMMVLVLVVSFGPGQALCANPSQAGDDNRVAGEEAYNNPTAASQQEYEKGASQDAVPGNHFKEICIGMSLQRVTDLIGPPSDTKQYVTGKSFIPFYSGTDSVRLEAVYKGMGRITFSGRPLQVYQVVTDTSESGFNE